MQEVSPSGHSAHLKSGICAGVPDGLKFEQIQVLVDRAAHALKRPIRGSHIATLSVRSVRSSSTAQFVQCRKISPCFRLAQLYYTIVIFMSTRSPPVDRQVSQEWSADRQADGLKSHSNSNRGHTFPAQPQSLLTTFTDTTSIILRT